MRKAKGVVMRTTGNKTVVYTNEGDFLEIPTPAEPPLVGQVIEVDLAPRRSFVRYSLLRYAAAAAVLVLAAALGIFNPLFGPGAAVASVALDINSGVELFVNKEARVVKIKDTGDGTGDAQGLRGRDVYEAVGLILKEAGEKGALGKEQNLVLATVVPIGNRGLNVVDEERLRGIIHDEMLSKNAFGVVMVSEADEEAKRRAENLGMTVNNYLVYDRCRQGGLDLQADAFRGGDVGKVLAEANTSLPGLFPGECLEVRPEHSRWQSGSGSGQPAGGGGDPQGMEGNRSWGTDATEHGSDNMEHSGAGQGSPGQWGTQGSPGMEGEHSGSWDGGYDRPAGGSPQQAQPPGGTLPAGSGQGSQLEPGEAEGSHETWQPSPQPAVNSGSGGTEAPAVKRKKASEEYREKESGYEGEGHDRGSGSE